MGLVRTEIRDRVALVTLDDPAHRNAQSLEMSEELASSLASMRASGDVGAVVITGTPPTFCAGAALDELDGADEERLQGIYHGFLAVARFPFPTIAAVNGPAVGAGMNLALACDVRLAGKRARFESRFLDLALLPGGGHTWMLRNILGPQGAAAMVMYGEALDGEAAVLAGLAWRCVDDAALLDEAVRLARKAAAAPPELARRLKVVMSTMAGVSRHAEAVEIELEPQAWSIRQTAFAERLAALRSRISPGKS